MNCYGDESTEIENVYNSDFGMLLSQERWILKSLRQIAEQRNSLQVEKLQLKHMLNNVKNGGAAQSTPFQAPTESSTSEKQANTNEKETHPLMSIEEMEAELPDELQTSDMSMNSRFLCNQQELDLNVEYPMLSYESSENGFEEDDSDNDLNFFLNGPKEEGYEYTQPLFMNKDKVK